MSPPEPTRPGARSKSLRQAASAMFAFTTIVPLMILVWTLSTLRALSTLPSQIGLGLALGIALLGFYIFRKLMGRIADLIQGLGAAMESSARPVVDADAPVGAPGPGPLPAPARPGRAAVPAAPPAPAAPAPPASPPPSDAQAVPGLGHVQEVRDLDRAVTALWQAEGAAKKGRRVIVSVVKASRPIPGTLVAVLEDGLLLEVEGRERITVSYKRISAIDTEEPSQKS